MEATKRERRGEVFRGNISDSHEGHLDMEQRLRKHRTTYQELVYGKELEQRRKAEQLLSEMNVLIAEEEPKVSVCTRN